MTPYQLTRPPCPLMSSAYEQAGCINHDEPMLPLTGSGQSLRGFAFTGTRDTFTRPSVNTEISSFRRSARRLHQRRAQTAVITHPTLIQTKPLSLSGGTHPPAAT